MQHWLTIQTEVVKEFPFSWIIIFVKVITNGSYPTPLETNSLSNFWIWVVSGGAYMERLSSASQLILVFLKQPIRTLYRGPRNNQQSYFHGNIIEDLLLIQFRILAVSKIITFSPLHGMTANDIVKVNICWLLTAALDQCDWSAYSFGSISIA
jgi:hypothetical protein